MEQPKETYQDTDGLYYPGEDTWGGVCPLCGGNKAKEGYGIIHQIGPDHWRACFSCQVRWCIGSNLFTGWKYLDDDGGKGDEATIKLLENLQDADDIYEASPLYEEKQRQSRENYEKELREIEKRRQDCKCIDTVSDDDNDWEW